METVPQPPARVGRRFAARASSAAALAALLLAGCGLRLETPDPEPLVPDALEVVRADTAAAAEGLRAMAAEADAAAAPEVAPVLARVAALSRAHLDALGGIYVPFPDVTPPAPTATAAPAPPASADDVLAALVESAAEARSDADAVADGPMARLLASVSVARSLLADALATALDTAAGPTVVFVVPETLPEGVTAQQAAVLVQSEDAAALAWEVTAARSVDADRDLAAARAVIHRDRAQAWAEASGVAGSGADPRRSSYALPDALDDPATSAEERRVALGEVEAALADAYMSLVAQASVGARVVLMDAVLDTLRMHISAGAPIPAFPGLPERPE